MNTAPPTASSDDLPLRARWAVTWAGLPRERVLAVAAGLAKTHVVVPLAVTQTGLGLLPMRETVERDIFYLGETPMSRSHVEIRADGGSGETTQGGAVIMADDADLADALAICDGVLAARFSGWESVAEMLNEGASILQMRNRIRKTMLTRSRVHFALLNDDDADARAEADKETTATSARDGGAS